MTLTQFKGLSDDLEQNLKICVSVRTISRSCQGYHKSPLVCDSDTIHGTFWWPWAKLKICVSVRLISRSCQGHHKSPLVCVTLTKFTGLSDDFDQNLQIPLCVSVCYILKVMSEILLTLWWPDLHKFNLLCGDLHIFTLLCDNFHFHFNEYKMVMYKSRH